MRSTAAKDAGGVELLVVLQDILLVSCQTKPDSGVLNHLAPLFVLGKGHSSILPRLRTIKRRALTSAVLLNVSGG